MRANSTEGNDREMKLELVSEAIGQGLQATWAFLLVKDISKFQSKICCINDFKWLMRSFFKADIHAEYVSRIF